MTHSVHIGPKVRRCDSVRPITHVLTGNRNKEKFRPVFKPTSELTAEERAAARLPALVEKVADAPEQKEDPREKYTGEERVQNGLLTPAEYDAQRKFVTRSTRGWFSTLSLDWFESAEEADNAKAKYLEEGWENLEVVPVETVDYDGR